VTVPVRIRAVGIGDDDVRFLRAMLYEAATWRPDVDHPPLEAVLAEPAIARYVDGWGRPGDEGVIAETGRATPVGAAWYRLFDPGEPGFGFVSAGVPELSVAVASRSRAQGIGRVLLEALIARARDRGHPGLSLSVEAENPAARLYARLGFVRAGGTDAAPTLLLEL
jgi:GNAT superfamily N-acetyltransferase